MTPPLTSQAAQLSTAGSSAGSGHLDWERAGPSPYFSRGTRGLPPRLQQLPAGRARPEHSGTPVAAGQLQRGSRLPAPSAGLLIQLTGGRRCAGSAQAGGGCGDSAAPAAVSPSRGGPEVAPEARGAGSKQR